MCIKIYLFAYIIIKYIVYINISIIKYISIKVYVYYGILKSIKYCFDLKPYILVTYDLTWTFMLTNLYP